MFYITGKFPSELVLSTEVIHSIRPVSRIYYVVFTPMDVRARSLSSNDKPVMHLSLGTKSDDYVAPSRGSC